MREGEGRDERGEERDCDNISVYFILITLSLSTNTQYCSSITSKLNHYCLTLEFGMNRLDFGLTIFLQLLLKLFCFLESKENKRQASWQECHLGGKPSLQSYYEFPSEVLENILGDPCDY